MKDYKPFIAIGVVLLIAIGVIAYALRGSDDPLKPTTKSTPNPPMTMPPHSHGNTTSQYIVEEFGDYQCPACGALFQMMKQVEKDYADRIRFSFGHFPLPSHTFGMLGARAAEAAARQNKFWEMHNKLYDNQREWGLMNKDNTSVKTEAEVREYFARYAGEIGLNVEQFKKDIDDPEITKQISSDQRRGTALGVQGTPTLFMSSPKYPTPQMLKPEIMGEPNGAGIRKAIEFLLGNPVSASTPETKPGTAPPAGKNGK